MIFYVLEHFSMSLFNVDQKIHHLRHRALRLEVPDIVRVHEGDLVIEVSALLFLCRAPVEEPVDVVRKDLLLQPQESRVEGELAVLVDTRLVPRLHAGLEFAGGERLTAAVLLDGGAGVGRSNEMDLSEPYIEFELVMRAVLVHIEAVERAERSARLHGIRDERPERELGAALLLSLVVRAIPALLIVLER